VLYSLSTALRAPPSHPQDAASMIDLVPSLRHGRGLKKINLLLPAIIFCLNQVVSLSETFAVSLLRSLVDIFKI